MPPDAGQLTEFEKRYVYRATATGAYELIGIWKPVVDDVAGQQTIIGYYRSSGSYRQMVDREGRVTWDNEAGVEPSLISPIDIFGPGIVTGIARGLGMAAERLAVRSAIRLSVQRVATKPAGQLVTRAALQMRAVAARLLARNAGEMVAGPFGSVPRAVLEAALKAGGPTVRVLTRLTSAPQAGRALSVAVGDGAAALTGAARAGGQLFAADIPKGLLMHLERLGLATLSTTRMGTVVGQEYRFLAAASDFIAPLFKSVGP